jgi:hypothetical protein
VYKSENCIQCEINLEMEDEYVHIVGMNEWLAESSALKYVKRIYYIYYCICRKYIHNCIIMRYLYAVH